MTNQWGIENRSHVEEYAECQHYNTYGQTNDIAKLKKERLALVAQFRSLMEPFYGIFGNDTAKLKKERNILSPQIRAALKVLDDFDLKQEEVREAIAKNAREAQLKTEEETT